MNKYFEKINLKDAKEIITSNDLNVDEVTDYTIGLFKDNLLIGTGSLYKNIIKLIAIKKEYQKENYLSLIITELIKELTIRGYNKYFLFTKTSEAKYFISLGFKEIVNSSGVSYLENNVSTITEELNNLKANLNLKGSIGASIVNCNPPTNGHLYLITESSKKHDLFIVFLVSEDRSFFPYKVREKILIEALKDLKNVIILPSTKYLISSSTFPSYFLKDLSVKSDIEMNLDVLIFKKYFMPIFNISKRYVGSEPLDKFTNAYNSFLKEHLHDKIYIYDRIKIKGTVVSASTVRKLFSSGNFSDLKDLVPKATYDYLTSDEAKTLLNKTQ